MPYHRVKDFWSIAKTIKRMAELGMGHRFIWAHVRALKVRP